MSKFTPSTSQIRGLFDKQVWFNDHALSLDDVHFNATGQILRMPLKDIKKIRDCHETSDRIGQYNVKHDGPCSVYLEDAIRAFFHVDALDEITPAMLVGARIWYKNQPLHTFNVGVNLIKSKILKIKAHDESEARQLVPGNLEVAYIKA